MQDETILCLATRRWHSLWRNTQQIMWRLAQTNRVVFVEPQRDPDLGYLASARRNARYFAALALEQITPNLVVVRTPPALPYARRALPGPLLAASVPAASAINNGLLAWHLRRVMRRLNVRRPILWLYDPRHARLAGRFGEQLTCYFVYDEVADFVGNQQIRPLLQAYDEAACRRADIVFASSQAQYRRRLPLNPHTYCVPNGVDHGLFSRAVDPGTPIAAEVAGLGRPLLGFVGWLGHQLDVPLLARLAAAYPDYSLALVGPEALERDDAYQALRSQPNVHFLGRQPLEALPGFLKAFDVALLPYRRGGHTYAIYPLKLHEYLAAGRSVLATDMPELRPFADQVRIARDEQSFLDSVPGAVADNSPERQAQRTALARQHTWEQRVDLVHQALDEHLARRRVAGYGQRSGATRRPQTA